MEQNIFKLNDKIYLNNNNILLEIIKDLNDLINSSHENLIIISLKNVVTKINGIINENKKNLELIRNDILSLYNQMNKRFDELKINEQELKYEDGKYIGQINNGLKEGKGIYYFNNGDRYEGEWKKDIKEGKGIYFYKSGNRYEGDYKNNKKEGKGIFYFNKGNRYEGDFKNDKFEGKGIKYFNNGDRRMGDYLNDKPIGIHVRLTQKGSVKTENHDLDEKEN